MQSIPTFSLNQPLSEVQQRTLAVACEDHGFFLVRDHGREALVDAVFKQSAEFFATPRETKLKILRDEANPLGYYDRELTKQKRDQKEVFDFKAGGYISSNPAKQTRWPDFNSQQESSQQENSQVATQFRDVLTEYFAEFTILSEQIMALVFRALGMPELTITETLQQGFGDLHSSTARLNYYPANDPVPQGEQPATPALGDMALHHHTDPDAITLLLQDQQGGLQACSKRDGWIDVTPEPGTIVVNIGDVLQVWTNDRCTAGMHRVLPVSSNAGRYSTPFFYSPRYDAQISPWVTEDEQPRYRDFSWREFIRGRVTDNFADYGADDIQIEKYRVA